MALMRSARVVVLAAALVSAAGCASSGSSGGLFHRGGSGTTVQNPAALGVNSFLWRASLDTLAFMPLASADPYGGVIITDWYSNPAKPDERFKATVYILDTRLRADGLNVTIFKQVKDPAGAWIDSAASDEVQNQIENAILTRARQLRLSNIR